MSPHGIETLFAKKCRVAALIASRRAQAALTAHNDRSGFIAIADGSLPPSAFTVAQPDGLFVPYGEYRHAKGLQKFDRASAEMLRDGIAAAPAPVYRGHPDVPGRADSNPAAPAVGWVNRVDVQSTGARFVVKYNGDGLRAVSEAHYRFYSPNWLLRRVPGGIQPVKLLSIGLTNSPLIPVPSIANDRSERAAASRDRSMVMHAVRTEFPGAGFDAVWAISRNRRPDLFRH